MYHHISDVSSLSLPHVKLAIFPNPTKYFMTNRGKSFVLHTKDLEITDDIIYLPLRVLRHERYINFNKEEQEQMRWTVMADDPMQTAKAPLIGIRTIEE